LAKFNSNDFYGAKADFTKAIALNPNFSEAYQNRAATKYNLRDYGGANADYTKAIQLNPNLTAAYLWRGDSKYKLGDKNGACVDWKKATQLVDKQATRLVAKYCNVVTSKTTAVNYYKTGERKYNSKDYYGAISDYSEAIQLNPNYSDAYNKRGGIQTKIK